MDWGPGRAKRKKLFSSQAFGRGGGSTSSEARATFPDLLPALPPPLPPWAPSEMRASSTQPETSLFWRVTTGQPKGCFYSYMGGMGKCVTPRGLYLPHPHRSPQTTSSCCIIRWGEQVYK